MKLSLFIARRYFFSKRKANFINIISILSMGGVAFITAALIIVLSIFNGLEDLLRDLNNSFDPELKIVAGEGKSFKRTDAVLDKIKHVDGVAVVSEVIEDYAYVRYRDNNQVVMIKGVDDNFAEQQRIPEQNIVEGEFKLKENGVPYAVIGRNVQYTLGISTTEQIYPIQVYYVKNLKSSGMDPSKLYSKKNILPAGVFSIVQTFDDNYVLVPLDFARDLLSYGDKRTSIEVKVKEGYNLNTVENRIQQAIGNSFQVMNTEEQHKELYHLLKMEKLFAFIALTMLLIVGSINIFFTLMMLALEKKKDISILSAMGASQSQIRDIFMVEGGVIALIGAAIGLVLGGAFCWVQLQFGILSMGMESAVTEGYPIKVRAFDFAAAFVVVAFITMLISFYPSKMASRFATVNQL